MQKIPWLDTTKCRKAIDCRAAEFCKYETIHVQPESPEQPGIAVDYPKVDLELCKRCGECVHACTENAIKMIPV
ncbi:MAG: 4Fe-4S binding protein [Actinobacteria bacterium]|nr:4Fe-4S binding protein [Actinomycetota bacterium]